MLRDNRISVSDLNALPAVNRSCTLKGNLYSSAQSVDSFIAEAAEEPRFAEIVAHEHSGFVFSQLNAVRSVSSVTPWLCLLQLHAQ